MSDTGTINRILKLVSLLADHSELSAKNAAQILGWPVSTTHRLLRQLSAAEFADQKAPGLFAPGLELYRIAGRLSSSYPYARLAEPLLKLLSQQFGETSLLTLLERKQLKAYIAYSAAPNDPMHYNVELNRRGSLVWGASGRALLAHLHPEEIAQAIAVCDETDAHGQTLDEAELLAGLEAIRANGYANTFSHRVLHAVGVAVPFLDVHGEVVGTVSFQIPEFRFDANRLPELVNALRHTTAVISQRIGATTQT